MPVTIVEGLPEGEPLAREREQKKRAERRLAAVAREVRWHAARTRGASGPRGIADGVLHRRVRQILAS